MKKKYLLMLIACAVLSCASCTKTADRVSANKTDVSDTYEITETSTASGADKLKLVYTSYREGNTVINYPRVEGMEDEEKQARINELILEDAKKVPQFFSSDFTLITVDYEIKKNTGKKIIIGYIGSGFIGSGIDGTTVYYETNLDVESETVNS